MIATVHRTKPASSTTRRVQKTREIPVFGGKSRTPTLDSASAHERDVSSPRCQTIVGIAAIETALGSRVVTNEEIAAHKAIELETEKFRKAEELAKSEKETNREALLTKLGITAEEAALLLS